MSRSSPSLPPSPGGPRAPLRRAGLAAALGLASAAFGLAAWAGGWLQAVEGITFDWRAKLFAAPAPADLPLRLILIDDESLERVQEVYRYDWPWPREFYGALVDRCREAGARAVGFDLRTPLPSDRVSSDQVFAESMARARAAGMPVVLPALPGDEGAVSSWPEGAPEPFHLDGPEDRRRDALALPAASFPTSELTEAATAFGHVRGSVREAGLVIRRIHPLRIFDGRPLLALGLAVWAAGEGVEDLRLTAHELRLREPSPSTSTRMRSVPLDRDGLTALRYRQPDPVRRHLYRSLSAVWVLEADEDELRDELAGRYVLLGASAAGTFDVFPTPVEPLAAGVEIHATALDNLLRGSFLVPAPWWAVVVFVVLLAFAGAAATTLIHRPGGLVPVFALGLGLPVGASFIAYPAGIWWPLAEPTAAAALALVAGTVAHAATEGRRRRFLLQAFGRYLSPVVVQRLVEDPSRLELGGERRELTIFFSDLEGFSSFSERLDPRELTTLLNDYLSEMTERILVEEGTLDKYEGDAILAFWNAPLDQKDHALRACRAALACQRRLAEIQDRLRGRAGGDLKMRIGIHSGPVVVGNLGSRTRFDYTVLGDAANVASRLEGANKAFGTYLMVSGDTWGQVAERFVGREIGEVVVVGRKTPVRVFEPLALAGEPEPPWLETYREGLEHLRAGRADEALGNFKAAREDPVARRYARRLREVSETGEGWDGVWRLTSK